MMVRPATRALIEDAHRYSTVYNGGFANHLPMGLVALDGMGASDEALARFAQVNARKLEPLGAAEAARVNDFRRRLAEEGLQKVFAAHAPAFASGISTAAFHGAIRTAYALESGSETEVAHALCYWDSSLHALSGVAVPVGSESPVQILQAISRDPAYAGKRPAGRSIAARMDHAAREPSFAAYAARLNPAFLHVDAFAEALIGAYAATGDFTLLHGVTGCHAFGNLAGLFPNQFHATCCLWTAIAAAYVASGSPPIEGFGLEGDDALTWTQVHAHAARCDDEHDVKLAYSCWREWQRTGEDLYRRAASARISHALEAAGVPNLLGSFQ
jgi:hypothetical protein